MQLDAVYGVPVAAIPEPLQSALLERAAQLPTLRACADDPLLSAYAYLVARWRTAYRAQHGRLPGVD